MKKQVFIASVILLTVSFYSLLALAVEPIRIGSPLQLSGTMAGAGIEQKNTLEMMAADLNKAGGINGRPIEFIFYDEEGKPDVAVSVVKRLIQKDKVIAILGLSASWDALPAIPIIQKEEIPTIVHAVAQQLVEPVNKWVFKIVPGDRIMVSRILSYMQSQGMQRIAIMSTQDALGDGGRNEIIAQAPAYGVKIVFDGRYTMEDTDITPTLSKIKKTEAQAVFDWSSARATITLTLNYRQIGMELPLFMSSRVLFKDFMIATGKNAEGIKTAGNKFEGVNSLPDSDPQKKLISEYQRTYKEKYGKEVDFLGGAAYDGFNIMVAALKKSGDDRYKLRDAIEQTKNYVGVSGIFNYSPVDHAGLTKDSAIIYRAVGGEWKVIK